MKIEIVGQSAFVDIGRGYLVYLCPRDEIEKATPREIEVKIAMATLRRQVDSLEKP